MILRKTSTLTLVLWLITSFPITAQNLKTFTGVILDEQGLPVQGAIVSWKGRKAQSTSGIEGQFSISQTTFADSILIVESNGYKLLELRASWASQPQTISLSAEVLAEVTITALGLSGQKERLGFSQQMVKGSTVEQQSPQNLVSGLAGQIAGAFVVSGNTGPGSSARIILRGENSLAGGNQPLFVIDGIPVANDRAQGRVDYGNVLSFINPADVADISVLKGPAASALYGARAANGAVLITTKKGNREQPMQVGFFSELTWDNPLRLPNFQNTFGNGLFGNFAFEDGRGGGAFDDLDENWGPRMEGQLLPQFDSPTENGFRGGDTALPNRGGILPTPYENQGGDQLKEYYRTAFSHRQQLTISGGTNRTDYRLSAGILENQGMVPNTDFSRNSLSGKVGIDLTSRLRLQASLMLNEAGSDNRIAANYGSDHPLYYFIGMGRQVNINSLKDYWQPGLEGQQQFSNNYTWLNNPYFLANENTNSFDHLRFTGSLRLNYQISDKWDLMLRTGRDAYQEDRFERKAISTQNTPQGTYREEQVGFAESNSDVLLTYQDQIGGSWTLDASAGASYTKRKFDLLANQTNGLRLPGIYSLANALDGVGFNQTVDQREFFGLYGFFQLGYKDMLFLEATGRNDWASTLPQDNNSFFYPSVSFSWQAGQTFQLPDFVSNLQFRAAYAQTGKEAAPLQASGLQSLQIRAAWDGTQVYSENPTLPAPDLRAETTVGQELGVSASFLDDRLNLDLTRYWQAARDQVLVLPISQASGYTSKVFNSGEIQNKGWEVMATMDWLPRKSKLQWSTSINWAANRNEVVSFPEGLDALILLERDVVFAVEPGGSIGDFYHLDFQFAPSGEQLHFPNGLPAVDPESPTKIGNYNPQWYGGLSNRLTWKNWSLTAMFDFRYGGDVYSQFYSAATNLGALPHTLPGRENFVVSLADGSVVEPTGELLETVRQLLPDGIPDQGILSLGIWVDPSGNLITDGDGNPIPNNVVVSAEEYYKWMYRGVSYTTSTFDASFVKLRFLQLTWSLPAKVANMLSLQEGSVSLFGRNVAMWTNVPHIDPESLSVNGNRLVPGYDDLSLAPARTLGIQLRATF